MPRVQRTTLTRAASPPLCQLVVENPTGEIITSESGKSVTLVARLSSPPPSGAVVAFGISVSDPSEGLVMEPIDLRFTSESWDVDTSIVIQGVPDELDDGDVYYTVDFTPQHGVGVSGDALEANVFDPWSGVVGTSVTLINRDTVRNRIGVSLVAPECASDIYQQNTSTCTVRWVVCYPDNVLGHCSETLKYDDVFGSGIASMQVDVWLENHLIPIPIDPEHTMGMMELNTSKSSNPYDAPRADGYFPSTLSARKGTHVDMVSVVAEDTTGEYEWRGTYTSALTFRANDDGVVAGNHNLTVRIGAFLIEANGNRYPSTGYLPFNKYFIVSDVPVEYGGTATAVKYTQSDKFNLTLLEVDQPGVYIDGCTAFGFTACSTSETGDTCELVVRLNAVPRSDVSFTVNIIETSDSYGSRYEGQLDGVGVQTKVVTMTPTEWRHKSVIIQGADDSIFEAAVYQPDGTVPYQVEFVNFTSDDPQFNSPTSVAMPSSTLCSLENEDDETGGYVVLQSLTTPPAGKVRSVDENGGSDTVELELAGACASDVYIPIYVESGQVSLSGSALSACPASMYNATLGIDSSTMCVTFTTSAWDTAQSVTYSGLDDGGTTGIINDGGATSFRIGFGPSYSADGQFNNLVSSVYGTVVDNDVIELATSTCVTKENKVDAYHASAAMSEIQTSCAIEISVDGSFFSGSGKTVESTTESFVVQVSATTDEGTFFFRQGSSNFTTLTNTGDHLASAELLSGGSVILVINATDDDLDDSAITYPILVETFTKFMVGGVETQMQTRSFQVNVTNHDDDTSGLRVIQSSEGGFTLYDRLYHKASMREESDVGYLDFGSDPPAAYWVKLPNNVTGESATGDNVTFSVSLITRPTEDVYVHVAPILLSPHPHGGRARYEGMPSGPGSSFQVTKEQSPDWVTGRHESCVGSMMMTFTPSDYDSPQEITVRGLDDLIDDYNTTYGISIVLESVDPNYQSSTSAASSVMTAVGDTAAMGSAKYSSNAFAPAFQVGLINTDDDEIGLVAYTDNKPGICSEPYYGYVEIVYVYLMTEPKATVLLTAASSLPTEAGPNTPLVSISTQDWTLPKSVQVSSFDDPIADGDKHFNMTIGTLFTPDPDYGLLGPNPDGANGMISVIVPFISLDDPDDVGATACPKGMYGLYVDVPATNPLFNDYQGCTYCPAGKWADENVDKVKCRDCPPGTYGVGPGAVSLGLGTDWAGEILDPACMPCPNGTYADFWGATMCKVCPPGLVCEMATVTPLPAGVEPSKFMAVKHWWNSLKNTRFVPPGAQLLVAMGFEADEDSFQMLMIVCAALLTAIFGVVCWVIKKEYPTTVWPKLKAQILKVDLFKADHFAVEEEGEESDKRISGAAATMVFVIASCAVCGLFAYDYFDRNFLYSQALVPRDEKNINYHAYSSFEVTVEFVGYAGCLQGSSDVNGDGVADTEFEIVDEGLVYEDFTKDWECYCAPETGYIETLITKRDFAWVNEGSYVCTWKVEHAKVDGVPSVEFSVKPTCDLCTEALDENGNPIVNEWGNGVNNVMNCQDCTLASAQGIRWWVYASPLWWNPEFPGSHNLEPKKDFNMVNGSIGLGEDTVFRGDKVTEIDISLIASKYENFILDKLGAADWGYRLQYKEITIGDRAPFQTVRPYYNGSDLGPETFNDPSSPDFETYYGGNLLRNFITDQTFVDVDNEVHVKVGFVKSDVMLHTKIDPKTKPAEASGVIGGLLGVISGIIGLFMIRYEMLANPHSSIRKTARRMSHHGRKMFSHFHDLHLVDPGEWGEMRELDPQEIKDLTAAFEEADVDKSGTVSFNELYNALHGSGLQLTRAQAHAIMDKADTDGNGELDLMEFMHIFAHHAPRERTSEEEKELDAPFVLEQQGSAQQGEQSSPAPPDGGW
ncbi:MAG: hypothetical protein CBC49_003755, partial [Alphaproteobacteria bacterium TMED89]